MSEALQRFDFARPSYNKKIRTFSRLNFAKIPGFDQDDLEVELWESLWIACKTYDPFQGATFNTYFWYLAKRKFADLIKHAFTQKRQSNIYTSSLDIEAVKVAVSELLLDPSAEEEVFARMKVRERLLA